ncbi:two pore domain potassium channel family protein [Flavihumibacter sp. R14]|nr:two pore domain potassium channel family protein [Flavihumibacter soli]
MRKYIVKLIYGNSGPHTEIRSNAISHIQRIQNVWNSDRFYDFGIERIFRLFLVVSKVFFPGIYIDYIFRNSSYQTQKVAGEIFVLFKTVMPFFMLYFELWHHSWLYIINMYLLLETYLYIIYKIFIPEHNHQRTHKRSLLLLFLNFFEVIGSFGVIYAAGDFLSRPVDNWIDALYFSFVTGATVGYGDLYPTTTHGKQLVILQIVSTLAFLILFFNFFTPRAQDTEGIVD